MPSFLDIPEATAPPAPQPTRIWIPPSGIVEVRRPVPPTQRSVGLTWHGAKAPPRELIARFGTPMQRVLRTWLLVATVVPVEITSWWRSREKELREGRDGYSQHVAGAAMDGLSPGLSRAQLLPYVLRAAKRTGASVPLEGSETSGRSVHVQGLPYGTVRSIATRE